MEPLHPRREHLRELPNKRYSVVRDPPCILELQAVARRVVLLLCHVLNHIRFGVAAYVMDKAR
jgi:hypothetical protein